MANNHHLLGPHSQAKSFKSLDGRGIIARRMKAIRDDLADSLGGWDALSPQKKILIDAITVRSIRCQMLTVAMLGVDGLSAEGERCLNWHANALTRDLKTLGLERHDPPGPSLPEHLAANYPSTPA